MGESVAGRACREPSDSRSVHAALRNPYNEIECSDHYSRAMASYGVFLAACGYEYHGPKGHIGFAPRLTPENFKAPFTAAEGWGTFTQTKVGESHIVTIDLKYGKLRLSSLSLAVDPKKKSISARITVNGKPLAAKTLMDSDGGRVRIAFPEVTLGANDLLRASIL